MTFIRSRLRTAELDLHCKTICTYNSKIVRDVDDTVYSEFWKLL